VQVQVEAAKRERGVLVPLLNGGGHAFILHDNHFLVSTTCIIDLLFYHLLFKTIYASS